MQTGGDGKDEGALRTIGETAVLTGIKPHVLRYWEEQFPSLKPVKRSGNRRYYRPADIALVREIDRLVNREGYTLKGARAALKGGHAAPAAHSAQPETAAPEPAPAGADKSDLLPRLKAIRDELEKALTI